MVVEFLRFARLSIVLLIVFVTIPTFAQGNNQQSTKRWVIGAGVNLREQADLAAPVIARMALNTPVHLIATIPNSKYCEVELVVAGQPNQRGFTACEFLSTSAIKPREIANHYLADGKTLNPNYNPERTFWLKPSYEALAEYGRHLERRRKNPKNDSAAALLAERPKMPEFERMKVHLGKGVQVEKPAPYWRWDDLKIIASSDDAQNRLEKIPDQHRIFHELKASLINAIELPIITNSYFLTHDEIAAPANGAHGVAAQFQFIEIIQTKFNKLLTKDDQFE